MQSVGTPDDLVSRIRHNLRSGERPIAFVVGSGLTAGTVTGVRGLVHSMRGALEDDADTRRFDSEVLGPSWGERYQQAADFLTRNRGPHLVNRVVRLAVLAACRSIGPQEARALVQDEPGLLDLEINATWELNPGVSALGGLLAQLPKDVLGPVVTTNFDPLIEIAVRKAGARVNAVAIDTDGRVVRTENAGTVDVIHVHGIWRLGDTLHTVHQLTRPRPLLEGSLTESLRGHLVVVIGYSGWPDAFSGALLARAKERQYNGMEVLWASYSPPTSEELETGLFGEMSAANAATIYGGIDANRVLPDVREAYRELSPGSETSGRLTGWTLVDEHYLKIRGDDGETGGRRRLEFFDGAEPSWITATDAVVPRLSAASRLASLASEALDQDGRPPIIALVGPMGEGKSMALRQCAVSIATTRKAASVYWREPGGRVLLAQVQALPRIPGHSYFLISDDGDLLIDDLQTMFRQLQTDGRSDIIVLLAAQERDWRNAGGLQRLGGRTQVVPADGLSRPDAEAIVTAWRGTGEAGLDELDRADNKTMVDRLLTEANDAYGSRAESLIGAMLSLRYGDALASRVGDLLERLDRWGITGSPFLARAFLMIAVVHVCAVGNRRGSDVPLSTRVLAGALNIDEAALDYVVLEPLGREAAISRHASDLWIRHTSIARCALAASKRRDPEELRGVIRQLVESAVAASPPTGSLPPDVYAIAYLERWLTDPHDRVVAAEAAVAAGPNRLSYRCSLVSSYMAADRLNDADAAARCAWDSRSSMVDPDGEPVLLSVWGVAAGRLDQPSLNFLLAAKSASLHMLATSSTTLDRSLTGMGAGLSALLKQTGNPTFADALAGVVTLRSARKLDRRAEGILKSLTNDCVAAGVDVPIADPWQKVQAALEVVIATTSDSDRTALRDLDIRSINFGEEFLNEIQRMG